MNEMKVEAKKLKKAFFMILLSLALSCTQRYLEKLEKIKNEMNSLEKQGISEKLPERWKELNDLYLEAYASVARRKFLQARRLIRKLHTEVEETSKELEKFKEKMQKGKEQEKEIQESVTFPASPTTSPAEITPQAESITAPTETTSPEEITFPTKLTF